MFSICEVIFLAGFITYCITESSNRLARVDVNTKRSGVKQTWLLILFLYSPSV